MKDIVAYIVKGIVDHPEQVLVQENLTGKKAIITISLADDDRGRVIGRGGRIIKAIRTLCAVAAAKKNLRVSIEIV
jgi:hypothetical protein